LRETKDVIETMGVERTRDRMKRASLIMYLVDLSNTTFEQTREEIDGLEELGIPYVKVGNSGIEPVKHAETRRNFLTILNSLVKTECQNPLLKHAA
jgi:tRNA modification GTPase